MNWNFVQYLSGFKAKRNVLLLSAVSCLPFLSSANGEVDITSSTYLLQAKKDQRYTSKAPPQSIAIVGGGIGGNFAAYSLRKLFGKDVSIDMYESSGKLCGRVATVEFNKRTFESGGTVLHPKNMYAKSVARKFGLKDAKSIGDSTSFFDGEKYFLRTSEWSIIAILQMIWAFGLDFIRLYILEWRFIDKFVSNIGDIVNNGVPYTYHGAVQNAITIRVQYPAGIVVALCTALSIYDQHKQGHSYSSVKDLLTVTGGEEFINASEQSSCQLFEQKGFGKNIIHMLVNGGLRTNYGQTCSVNGFVGMVSMAGIQPNLWAVDGGNKQLCEKLFENASVNLIHEQVTKVSNNVDEKFFITTTNFNAKRVYDIVVIATPINRDKSNIDVKEVFTGEGPCPSATSDPRHYRKTTATFVKGNLNASLFQCTSPSSCPAAIFMTEDRFYRSIGLNYPVDFDPKQGDSYDATVYKIFSTDSLTDAQLSYLFENIEAKTEVPWEAYPLYNPPDQLDTFVLNKKGVYYTSPIEWAASAIEMSMISGKNVALLAFNNWYEFNENVNQGVEYQKKSEL